MKRYVLFGLCMFCMGVVMGESEKALFGGGCFWCMEAAFKNVNGVTEVVSGYAGGKEKDPSYDDYAQKGYIEVVQVSFDPKKISYDQLLDIFWQQIDPTDEGGQFGDRGPQYRSAIFFFNDQQKKIAEASKDKLQKSGRFSKDIKTQIIKASTFYKAEPYHQDYSGKNPIRYKLYKSRSGREDFTKKAWHNSLYSDEVLRKKLTPLQYEVTQKNGTEPAFKNEYWNNKEEGIYVDIVSGEPLFSSKDKFDAKTGWPSFTKPLEPDNVVEKEDRGWFSKRTEVRSKRANSHLGHVFDDGPQPTGKRYCINSAALRFIPKKDLEKEGFGQYKKLFSKETKQK